MFVIIGSVIVMGCVIGGYMAMGGKLGVLYQPFELVIIGGAAVGAFVIANTKPIMSGTATATEAEIARVSGINELRARRLAME